MSVLLQVLVIFLKWRYQLELMRDNFSRMDMQNESNDLIDRYKNMTVAELKQSFGQQTDNKASFIKLARQMLNSNDNQLILPKLQASLNLKTVRLTGGDVTAEAMSFTNIDFEKWLNTEKWENSPLYQYFADRYFLFFVFRQFTSGKRVADDEMTFAGVKVWTMSEYDLQHGLKQVWYETCRLLKNNELIITPVLQKNGKVINKNNLPSSKFNYLGHLRPGAVNGNDKVQLPTGQSIVKQRFWFNREYVKEIINS